MSPRRKYPRTPHLPWSPGAHGDDVLLKNCAKFEGKRVVVTEKMDGENSSLYRDGTHARSLDSGHHSSRNLLKAWHAGIAHRIPEGWRLCGENVYARHSIVYDALPGFFFLLSVWNAQNECLDWDSTVEWAGRLGCPVPVVLWRGLWDAAAVRSISVDPASCEGYVVRLEEGFPHSRFGESVAKWVRPSHVTTDEHWMHAPVVPNRLLRNG